MRRVRASAHRHRGLRAALGRAVRRTPDRPSYSAWPPAGGVSEGLAVMLSVVVFGLGIAALVAQEELRAPSLAASPGEPHRVHVPRRDLLAPSVSPDDAGHVPPSSSSVAPRTWSPARDVAR